MADIAAPINRKKILLVDDDEMMRIFLRDIFWVHGKDDKYHINAVANIDEAKKFLSNPAEIPDIIFLDLMMPGGGSETSLRLDRSLEFLKEVKTTPAYTKVHVVVFSGQRDSGIKETVKNLGADDYLVKGDLMPKEIIEFVDKLRT